VVKTAFSWKSGSREFNKKDEKMSQKQGKIVKSRKILGYKLNKIGKKSKNTQKSKIMEVKTYGSQRVFASFVEENEKKSKKEEKSKKIVGNFNNFHENQVFLKIP
jgi:hypothetical protein